MPETFGMKTFRSLAAGLDSDDLLAWPQLTATLRASMVLSLSMPGDPGDSDPELLSWLPPGQLLSREFRNALITMRKRGPGDVPKRSGIPHPGHYLLTS